MPQWLEDWTRDFTLAARGLRRAPGFAAVTIATLALAIGANTAIFSVVDAVLLDPLDLPAAERLVSIRASAPGSDLPEEFGPAPEFYVQYGEQADMLEDLGMFQSGQTTVRSDDQIDRLFITQATPDFFTTLGARAQLGRLPTTEDAAGQVMVLSDWLWRTWFGADPEVVGRSYAVSEDMTTVIGVMQPEFRFPDPQISLWVHQMLGDENQLRPGNFGFNFVGRVRPDTNFDDLEAQLGVLASRLPERFGGPPQYARIIEQHRPVVRTLEEQIVGDVAGPLWLLMGTVGIVLLIACANVANLFTVRAEGRRGDLDVRQALGAGRGGLVRGQMAEAILLAALGGAGGVILARLVLPLLVALAPENVPNLDLIGLSATALAFAAGVSILTACAFGLAPAVRFSSPRLVGGLRQSGGVRGGRSWGRDALVLVQTASALVLLVGAGLLLRSFWTLSRVDPGFDTQDIFTFQVAPARDEVNDGPSYARFHQEFMERVAALPGVESVGLANTIPLDEGAGTSRFHTEATLLSGEEPPPTNYTMVGGEYFETMGIALERGRTLDRSDHVLGAHNAVVSSAAAEQFWPAEEPLGRQFRLTSDTTAWMTVVGVVEDIFLRDFRQDAPDPMVYLPMVGPQPRTWAVGSPAYVVKSSRADVLAPDVRALMREHVPESPMYRVFTLEALADRSMAQLSFTMMMLAIASGLALVLGAVGLYGVLSYVVSNRAPEIAVRMALGAEAQRVQRMVVLQGARITAAGVAVGLVAALALTRVLDSLLFGVGSLDVPTFVAMSAVMIAVALLASYVPARRASSVDPMRSLRVE
jgi:predicted permease